jgi:steroid 5-alpha reductase family enzyme
MLNQLLNPIYFSAAIILVYMSAWFLVSLVVRRNDVADVAWGLGFVVVAVLVITKSDNFSLTSIITTYLILIWGIRLSWHIGSRNLKKAEDFRYKVWRDSWGKWFYLRSYFQVFILQGFLMLIISTPIIVIDTYSVKGIFPFVMIGGALWIFGFIFETISDAQLKNFISLASNKGQIMDRGLWRYSRHPNYFGEITQWWAIGIIALSFSYGWLGLLGPITITFLITKVSGIPMLENKYANNLLYQKYKLKTSLLIPLPRK